jgi:hypothetical protein
MANELRLECSACLGAVNTKKLRESVYEYTDKFDIMLKEETCRMLFERLHFNLSLQKIIMATRSVAKFMLGGCKEELTFDLKPLEIRESFETEEVKQAILTKTVRQLGMSKSSHWNERKKLRETGLIRLYRKTWHYFVER